MHPLTTSPILVSSCLVGLCTRYDGCIRPSDHCRDQLKGTIWIPVCPEQLGGLPTPRSPADIVGGSARDVLSGKARIITREGDDVTAQFIQGAKQALMIAESLQVKAVFFKANSPSCGVINPQGVTAALLEAHGFKLQEF